MQHGWDIEFTDEFGRWWDTLPLTAQEAIAHDVEVLGHVGPALGRPPVRRTPGNASKGRTDQMKARKWSELKRRMPPESRARVDARVAATLAAMPLTEVRKAIGMTQAELAGNLETGQGTVSKLEHATDMYLSTLRKYVEALGGELHLIASFPQGRRFEIERIEEK